MAALAGGRSFPFGSDQYGCIRSDQWTIELAPDDQDGLGPAALPTASHGSLPVHVLRGERGAGKLDRFGGGRLSWRRKRSRFPASCGEASYRYTWGKWSYPRDEAVDYAGREILQRANVSFQTSMARYTKEPCKRIPLLRGRASQRKAPVTEEERTNLRGLFGSLLWVAREGRPDAAGEVSLLAGRIADADVEVILAANRLLDKLLVTADLAVIILSIPWEFLRLAVVVAPPSRTRPRRRAKSHISFWLFTWTSSGMAPDLRVSLAGNPKDLRGSVVQRFWPKPRACPSDWRRPSGQQQDWRRRRTIFACETERST